MDQSLSRKRERASQDFDEEVPSKKAMKEDMVFLVANGKKFRASKEKLISECDFFKLIFSGDSWKESRMSELPQGDKSGDEMELFLRLLNKEDCLTEENIFSALGLAGYYQASGVVRQCEEWIERNVEMSVKEKVELAYQYHLEGLMKALLNTMTTVSDIEQMVPEKMGVWSKSLTTLVLRKTLEFYGIPKSAEERSILELEARSEIIRLQVETFERMKKEIGTNDVVTPPKQDSGNGEDSQETRPSVPHIAEMSPKEKFDYAVKESLNFLKKDVLNALLSVFDIEQIVPSDVDSWDKDTTLLVLWKALELCGIPQSGTVAEKKLTLQWRIISLHFETMKNELRLIKQRNRERLEKFERVFLRIGGEMAAVVERLGGEQERR